MARDEEARKLLIQLGYDPDDPAYSVQWLDGVPAPQKVTGTETELEAAIKAAINSLLHVLSLLDKTPH